MVDGLSNLTGLFPHFRKLNYEENPKSAPSPDVEKYRLTMFEQQKFDKADMIVVGIPDGKDFQEFESRRIKKVQENVPGYVPSQEYFNFPLWAIYGNVVVEGSIHKGNIRGLARTNKSRMG